MVTSRQILKEAKELNSLVNAFVKRNPNANSNDLAKLFTADPTTIRNSRGTFAGKYCIWIGNQYVNGKLKVGDIPELKKALTTYNINKSQITTPISGIKSLSDLIAIISNYTDDFKATRQLSKGEQTLEKVYEDADWVVYIPHTYEASRKIGGDTSWCTASSDSSYFNMYTKDGPLYVNIRKSDGSKYQFHFDSRRFMNADDEKVSIRELGLSEGLVKFYETVYPNFNLYMKYDDVGKFYNGYAGVLLNNKWNLVDTQGKLFSPNQWFDDIGDFYDGYVRIKLNNKWNYINFQGKLLSPNQWFDLTSNFYNGYATVKLNSKWNLINTQGNLVSTNLWFDYALLFFDGYAVVKLNYKYNFIDTQGKLLSPNLWFDGIDYFSNGYARVILNGKWYKIDTKGNIVTTMNEHTVVITKSDLSKIVLECVERIRGIN